MKHLKYRFGDMLRSIKFAFVLHMKILRKAEVCISTRCTLKCVDCSNLNADYYAKNTVVKPGDLNIEKVIDEVGVFLACLRGVRTIKVIGGEPLLHPEFYKIINYLIKQNKVGRIEVTTNGTLIPKNENLKCLDNKKVNVVISDYGKLSTKKAALQKMFEENKIAFSVYTFADGMWLSPGPVKKRNRTVRANKQVWKNCVARDCKHLLNGVLYGCPRMAHANTLRQYSTLPEESVELTSTTNASLWKKIKRLYSRKYLPFCNYCDGLGKFSKKIVPAIQINPSE